MIINGHIIKNSVVIGYLLVAALYLLVYLFR